MLYIYTVSSSSYLHLLSLFIIILELAPCKVWHGPCARLCTVWHLSFHVRIWECILLQSTKGNKIWSDADLQASMSKFNLCRSCFTHHGSWRLRKAHHFQTASSGFPRRAAAALYVYWTNDVDLLKDDNLAQMLSNLCKWETWMQEQEWRVDKEFRPTQMHPSIPRIPFLCQHRGICETSLYQQLLCAKHVGLHVILRPYCSWAKDLNWSKCFSAILAHWAWWRGNDKTNICESGLLIVFNGSHTLQENQLCFISSASEFWRPGSAEPL